MSDDQQDIESLIRMSDFAADGADYEKAFNLALKAVEAAPDLAMGYVQCVDIALRAGLPELGLQPALEALRLNPVNVELLLAAACCAYHSESAKTLAMQLSRRAIDAIENGTDLRLAGAHYYLGNALDDSGQYHAATAHLEIARCLNSGEADYHNDAGLSHHHANEMAEAIACYEAGLSLAPTNANLLANYSVALIETGDVRRARQTVERLRQHHQGNEFLPVITSHLATVEGGAGLPAPLWTRAPIRDTIAIAHCSCCPCRIPMTKQTQLLCAGCGAELKDIEQCPYCGHDGFALLGRDIPCFRCPYCRSGLIGERPTDEEVTSRCEP